MDLELIRPLPLAGLSRSRRTVTPPSDASRVLLRGMQRGRYRMSVRSEKAWPGQGLLQRREVDPAGMRNHLQGVELRR